MPTQLTKSPLIEALFEIRFEPTAPAAGDLLPGLLYSAMKIEYPEVVPLPVASIPRQIRDSNPNLLYQASHRLVGGPNSVQIGDRVVALSTTAYPGWLRFKDMVEFLVEAAKGTGLLKRVDRFSFKYINLIEALQTEEQLPLLNLQIKLTGSAPLERGFQLRVERNDGDFITIIQIAPNATTKHPATAKEVSGLLIEVDTLRLGVGNEFLTNRASLIDEGHSVAKRTFFSLLTGSALERLGPVS